MLRGARLALRHASSGRMSVAAMSSSAKTVPLSAAQLEELAQQYGTPFQLYDEAAIRRNARGLFSAFGAHFPEFRQFFAVKALPNPAILAVLKEEGCGMDCSSTSELFISEKLGVEGENIVYTSNFTSKKDLKWALDQGVNINLDDASLLDALLEVGGGKMPAGLSFRLNPGLGRTDSETASNVLGGPDAKFGVPPFQIMDAYRRARDLGVKEFGIHMMTGSCVLDDDYWQETVTALMDVVAKLRAEGIEMKWMNIGGGLGIPYKPGEETVDVPRLAARLRQTIDAKAAEHGVPAPSLCMENGRYMTGPYGYLVSRCEAVKDSWDRYYGLDACMANLMRPGMYGSYHHITIPAREQAGGERSLANVVGTLCENNDWFAKERSLPTSAAAGDLFVIHDTGAHSHSMGFQYNGKLRAPELLLREDGSVDLIRERETIEGLYANTAIPADLEAKVEPPLEARM